MLYKRSLKGEIPFEEFRAYRNKLISIIRQSKMQYFLIFAIGISLKLREYGNKVIPLQIVIRIETIVVRNSHLMKSTVFCKPIGPTAVANLPRATFYYIKYVQPMLNSLYLTEVTENVLYQEYIYISGYI